MTTPKIALCSSSATRSSAGVANRFKVPMTSPKLTVAFTLMTPSSSVCPVLPRG